MPKEKKADKFIRENRMILLAALKSHAKLMDTHLTRLSMETPGEGPGQSTKDQLDALCDHFRLIGDMAREADSWIEQNYEDETSFEEKMAILDRYERAFGNDGDENSDH